MSALYGSSQTPHITAFCFPQKSASPRLVSGIAVEMTGWHTAPASCCGPAGGERLFHRLRVLMQLMRASIQCAGSQRPAHHWPPSWCTCRTLLLLQTLRVIKPMEALRTHMNLSVSHDTSRARHLAVALHSGLQGGGVIDVHCCHAGVRRV